MAREKAHRVAGIHSKGLLLGHCRKILHDKPVLGPILENGPIASIDNKLMRMLGNPWIKIILDHGHNRRGLGAFRRVLPNRARVHWIIRAEAVHIDASVVP